MCIRDRYQRRVHGILYEFCNLRPGITVPEIDVRRVLDKFQFENWETNTVEKFYIGPLFMTFEKLVDHMRDLALKGMNHWLQPLNENKEFCDLIRDLIEKELVCEFLMGTPLRKDQLNFLFNSVRLLYDSARDRLLKAEEHSVVMNECIPQIVIFKYLQHIQAWQDKKKAWELTQPPKETIIEEKKEPEPKKDNKMNTTSSKLFNQTQTTLNEAELEEKRKREQEEEENKRFGRIWIWVDFMTDVNKELLEAVDLLRNINPAVQQDIDDFIITKANQQVNKGKKPDDKKKDAHVHSTHEKKIQITEIPSGERRPPFLWNDPQVVDEHKYRSHAKPHECYIDKRVDKLFSYIEKFAENLSTTNKERWERLVLKVLDVYKEEANIAAKAQKEAHPPPKHIMRPAQQMSQRKNTSKCQSSSMSLPLILLKYQSSASVYLLFTLSEWNKYGVMICCLTLTLDGLIKRKKMRPSPGNVCVKEKIHDIFLNVIDYANISRGIIKREYTEYLSDFSDGDQLTDSRMLAASASSSAFTFIFNTQPSFASIPIMQTIKSSLTPRQDPARLSWWNFWVMLIWSELSHTCMPKCLIPMYLSLIHI
eukprot:TRINITY_DN4702_c0_g1_i5.p1 TRINITY_DN4702_c0_g1~~TRINITY_DN4702_c0_g1_i5.p1  ORF type:complete len:610 (-),score=135.70 TRINITY_DN4702_c0_g1_i5:61-1842(-)